MESSGTVEALLSLQEIDRAIEERTARLEALEEEIAEEAVAVSELEERVAAVTKELDEARERQRRHERSVQAGRATLKRLEARADEVQNMKQHLAVRSERDTARRNLRQAEDEVLRAMQDVDDRRKRLAGLEAELEEKREEHERRVAEADAQRVELEEEIAVHRDRRKNKETRLDGRILRLYQKVRSGRTEEVLAPLTEDGVCGHCFTAVPLQRQADIRAGRQLGVCEGCGVILYVPDGS